MINGARVWIRVGGLSFQPAELAKIFLVLFLAGFLRENASCSHRRRRASSASACRRCASSRRCSACSGPALLLLVAMNDFGTSLLFFGVFVAIVYVATGRIAYAVIGLVAFAGGSAVAYTIAPQVAERVSIWLDPWTDVAGERVPDRAVALHGRRRRPLRLGARPRLHPDRHRRSVIPDGADRLHLLGDRGRARPGRRRRRSLLCYVLFAYRGFKIASRAGDGFSSSSPPASRSRSRCRRS